MGKIQLEGKMESYVHISQALEHWKLPQELKSNWAVPVNPYTKGETTSFSNVSSKK